MHPFIERHRAEIAALCRQHGVRNLEVFGSAARKSDFDDVHSDVDFLVEFDSGARPPSLVTFFALRDALQTMLGRRVDLVTLSAVTNPYVRSDMERTRERVYAA
ncbi:MAG: nucleotidyltransferase domain-containing protein [Candidatus Rokubacteria bacterium]|nr:nucleotidyltransferase domain-containing protein [Candidatus Rokubacteria bacterium]